MKKISLLLVLALLLGALVSSPAIAAPVIPQPSSQFYVLDQANVLEPDTEQIIVQTSAELARQTKAQVVVVTTNTLDGASPEEYALAILRGWGIGDKVLNNGLLILVSPTERVSRIEVGYGLEGALNDAKTGQIQDIYMIPYFSNNNFDQGILNGYSAIVQEVAKEYGVTVNIGQPQPMAEIPAEEDLPLWVYLLVFLLLGLLFYVDQRFLNGFILGLLVNALSHMGRGGGGGFGGGGSSGWGGGGGFSGGGGSGGGGGSTRSW